MKSRLVANQTIHGQTKKKLRQAKGGRRAVISNRHTKLMWITLGKQRRLPTYSLYEAAAP